MKASSFWGISIYKLSHFFQVYISVRVYHLKQKLLSLIVVIYKIKFQTPYSCLTVFYPCYMYYFSVFVTSFLLQWFLFPRLCVFYCSQRSVLLLLYYIRYLLFNFTNPFTSRCFPSFLYYILHSCSSLFVVKALDVIYFLLSTTLTMSVKSRYTVVW